MFLKESIYLCYGRCSGFTPPYNWEGAGGPLAFDHGSRLVVVDLESEKTIVAKTFVTTFENTSEQEFAFTA